MFSSGTLHLKTGYPFQVCLVLLFERTIQVLVRATVLGFEILCSVLPKWRPSPVVARQVTNTSISAIQLKLGLISEHKYSPKPNWNYKLSTDHCYLALMLLLVSQSPFPRLRHLVPIFAFQMACILLVPTGNSSLGINHEHLSRHFFAFHVSRLNCSMSTDF